MTTSEPRTPHDDTPREHRRIGQRILDAVLGDPADTRPDDPADPRRADPNRAGAEGFAGDGPRGGYSSYEQATRDHPAGGTVQGDRAATQGDLAPHPNAGDMPADALHDVSQAGRTHRDDALRDAGYDAGDTASDARRDTGRAGYVDRNDAVRDVGDTAFDDRRVVGRADATAAPRDPGHDQPGSRDYDVAADTGYVDDPRRSRARDHDPGQDTGYVDAPRTEADRTTGRRHADFGTGHDDTATVDGTDAGRTTAETAATGDGRVAAGVADEDGESGARERLVPAERADDYGSRWDALKGDFVDEPRRAVRQADELVGELLDELQRLFADQRRNLEQGFDHDQASTEDLRLALRRYRSFFDRLLSF